MGNWYEKYTTNLCSFILYVHLGIQNNLLASHLNSQQLGCQSYKREPIHPNPYDIYNSETPTLAYLRKQTNKQNDKHALVLNSVTLPYL